MTANNAALASYYQLHASIYDSTRWSFLFGREKLLRLTSQIAQPQRVLEIGCGTGRNLARLCELFPNAQISGIDLSSVMLEKARTKLTPHSGRVRLINGSYDAPIHGQGPKFDLIVCSYALSMFNPGWERAIDSAVSDLADGGYFALVDFHDTHWPWFRRWMGVNHVRMESQLRPSLQTEFRPVIDRVQSAYGGLWEYVTFIGQKQSLRMN